MEGFGAGRKAQGLGLDVGDLTKANFDSLGMTRTNLYGITVSKPMSPMAGTIRASRRHMKNAVRFAWRDR